MIHLFRFPLSPLCSGVSAPLALPAVRVVGSLCLFCQLQAQILPTGQPLTRTCPVLGSWLVDGAAVI
eukprot:s2453_g12.t1